MCGVVHDMLHERIVLNMMGKRMAITPASKATQRDTLHRIWCRAHLR